MVVYSKVVRIVFVYFIYIDVSVPTKDILCLF